MAPCRADLAPGASPLDIAPVDASYKAANDNSSGISPSGNYTYSSSTHDLTVTRNRTINLAGGTYYFNNVALNSGAVMVIQNKVTMYVTGQFSAGPGTITNQTGVPSNFILYSSFSCSGGSCVTLPAGSSLYGAIYARDATITFGVGGQFYGSVVGNTVDDANGSSIHYDEALKNIAGIGGVVKFAILLGSWTER